MSEETVSLRVDVGAHDDWPKVEVAVGELSATRRQLTDASAAWTRDPADTDSHAIPDGWLSVDSPRTVVVTVPREELAPGSHEIVVEARYRDVTVAVAETVTVD